MAAVKVVVPVAEVVVQEQKDKMVVQPSEKEEMVYQV